MTKNPFNCGLLAGLMAAGLLGAVDASQAQGTISASATIFGVQSGGNYNYTLTLRNDVSSTDPIQTFWFAWFPGADLMSSMPSNIQTPANWAGYVQGGVVYNYGYPYPDGYSIEFTTGDSGSALNPGGSMTFTFTSPDAPQTMAGLSPYPYYSPNYYSVGISYVYMDGAPGAGQVPAGDVFPFTSVVPTPEPSTVALMLLGGVGAWMARRRQVRISM